MWKVLIDRNELFLKSIPKSKILTFLGIHVYWTLVNGLVLFFSNQIEPPARSGPVLKKKFGKKIYISNHCISPTYTVAYYMTVHLHLMGPFILLRLGSSTR